MDFSPTPLKADDAPLQRALQLFDDYKPADPNLLTGTVRRIRANGCMRSSCMAG
ncbi:hypothetical protein [Achromobacter insolitus]|uniref:hypothetical protein n=1 Tax=Achromobacter insolitus TaxID=217204 RepID=UPI001FCA4942|nr:hypothetical protein [Achromobacter insolitus]